MVSDGPGLVVAIDNSCQEFCGIQGGRSVAELWTSISRRGDGEDRKRLLLAALVWDGRRSASRGVTGPADISSPYNVIDLSGSRTRCGGSGSSRR